MGVVIVPVKIILSHSQVNFEIISSEFKSSHVELGKVKKGLGRFYGWI